MKHFLIKESLYIRGFGGSKPQAPQPPIVAQFPSVLAPPQYSQFNSINSFSYAEMIDLISDGPIEGLVNKNGKKVYEENIFEGIYLNDVQVKETSSIENQYIPVYFLKNALKRLWASTDASSSSKSITLNYRNINDIDDPNFNSDITLTYFKPDFSVSKFVSMLGGDLNSSLLIDRAFQLTGLELEKPFLTIINIPSFKMFLSKERFDEMEGGEKTDAPIKLGMSNISEHFYFSVPIDKLTSHNSFDMPRSFILNNVEFDSGKKGVKKLRQNNELYLEYEVYDVNIIIWSVYDIVLDAPKNFDKILDQYFSNIYAFQNKKSLYNYNLVNSEFRNGSEIQVPLKGFCKTEMDIEIGKELIGPFRLTNNFTPSFALDAGGVQRINTFNLSFNNPPSTNLDLTQETSDDIRYIKNWPVEYDSAGNPYVIQGARTNYAQFDKTSTSRPSSDAVPIVHYISNQNVEEVYVTVNLNQLSDTNHIDLVAADNPLGTKKSAYSDGVPYGTPTYSQLPGVASISSSTKRKKYFLLYGSSVNDAFILGGACHIGALLNQIVGVTNPGTDINYDINFYDETPFESPFFCAYQKLDIDATKRYWQYSDGLTCSTRYFQKDVLNTIQALTDRGIQVKKIFYEKPEYLTKYYNNTLTNSELTEVQNSQTIYANLYTKGDSPVKKYLLPNGVCSLMSSINTKTYINNRGDFERLLKQKDSAGNPLYSFSLDDNERLSSEGYFDVFVFSKINSSSPDWNLISSTTTPFTDKLIYPSYKPTTGPSVTSSTDLSYVNALYNFIACTQINAINAVNQDFGGKFFIASVNYFAAPDTNLEKRAIVATKIFNHIPFTEIFNNWTDEYRMSYPVTLKIDKARYPYISKYIIDPFINNRLSFNQKPVLLGLTYKYLYSVASFWSFRDSNEISNLVTGRLKIDALEQLLFNFGYNLSINSNFSSSSVAFTNPFQEAIGKLAGGQLVGNFNLYSFSAYDSYSYIPWYTTAQLYIKNNFNIFTTESHQSATFTYNTSNIYLYNKDYNKVSVSTDSWKFICGDVIMFYTLAPNQSVFNYTNALSSAVQYGLAKDGKVEYTDTAKKIPNTKQQITAGSKLPAVVSIKVETGYEGQEQEQRFNTTDYFAYKYDIFGIASEQAMIDLGRNSADYVYSKRINSESGGYFKDFKNEYLNPDKIYFYNVTLKENGVTKNFYLFDSEIRSMGDLLVGSKFNNTTIFSANPSLSITVLTSGSTNIGLRKTVNYTSVNGDTTDTINEAKFQIFHGLISNWKILNEQNDFLVSAGQLAIYLSNNKKQLNLSSAINFFKTAKNGKTLFPPVSFPVDPYVQSTPISSFADGFDRYEVYLDSNNFLSVDLYTYVYNSYNIINISSGQILSAATAINNEDLSFVSKNLYFNMYRERANKYFNFLEIASQVSPEDYFFYLFQSSEFNIIGRLSPNKESSSSTFLDFLNQNMPLEYTNAITQDQFIRDNYSSLISRLKRAFTS